MGASTTLTVSLYTIFVNTAPSAFCSTAAMFKVTSCGCISVAKVYVTLALSPAGTATLNLDAVRFLNTCGGFGAPGISCVVNSEPPITATVTGAGSWLETSRTALVGWPLTSFTPKISDCGNEALMSTARVSDCSLDSSPISPPISWMSSTCSVRLSQCSS